MSSGKPKRFDLKSPYSPYIEKDQFKESDFFIHSRPPIKSKRPTSAKNNDTRSGKSFKTRKPIRPVSATKQRPRPRSGLKRTVNRSFLGRMQSKKVGLTKDLFFDRQMALKNKINSVSDENLKFQRKISHQKNEKIRPIPERSSPSYSAKKPPSIDAMKRCIQELRQVINAKDEEIAALKKNLKITRLKEMEIELQAYIDECTRLRHHLEEVVKERDDIEQGLQEMSNGQGVKKEKSKQKKKGKKQGDKHQDVSILKGEVKKLKHLLKISNDECKQKDEIFQSEYQKWNKKMQEKEQMIANFQGGQSNGEQKGNLLIQKIQNCLQRNNLTIVDFVKEIDLKSNGIVELAELPKILSQKGITITKNDYNESIQKLFGKIQGKVSTNQVQTILRQNSEQEQKQQQSPIQKAEVIKPAKQETEVLMDDSLKEKMQHIALRMQLHRIPKQNATNVLFGSVQSIEQKLTQDDFKKILMNAPLSFTKEDNIDSIVKFFVSEPKTVGQISEMLQKYLDDWTVFSQDDETNFDREIAMTISKKKQDLIAQCSKFDQNQSGVITEADFQKVMIQLSIKFDPKIMKYMQLLFYSHKNTLNKVPYRHFIEAYGSLNNMDEEESMQSESLDDEERAQIVRYFLAMISDALKKSKLSLKDVFQPDDNQILYPDMFVKGLSRLGLEIEQDHILIILEALQYEEEDEFICVHFKEFSEIMSHYGVGSKDDQNHPEHIQRVSLLDSNDEYNYSEDSNSKTSPKLSENSPFGSSLPDKKSLQQNFNPYEAMPAKKFGATDSSYDSEQSSNKSPLFEKNGKNRFLDDSMSSGSIDIASNASF